MDFESLLFAILDRFTPMDANKVVVIKQKMQAWLHEQIFSNENATGIKLFLKNHLNEWYMHLAFAILYIPLCVMIQRSLSEVTEEDKETFKV